MSEWYFGLHNGITAAKFYNEGPWKREFERVSRFKGGTSQERKLEDLMFVTYCSLLGLSSLLNSVNCPTQRGHSWRMAVSQPSEETVLILLTFWKLAVSLHSTYLSNYSDSRMFRSTMYSWACSVSTNRQKCVQVYMSS